MEIGDMHAFRVGSPVFISGTDIFLERYVNNIAFPGHTGKGCSFNLMRIGWIFSANPTTPQVQWH